MATYVRQSSFSDGDTITSALFNNEFNQLVNAFNASSGHTHDGSTAGDGGPISNLFSNSLVFGTNANIDVAITFNATTNDGVLTWMEDEDYFKFSDDLLIDSTEKVQFRDTGLYIYSSADGQLDIVADTEVQIAATTIDINGNADISGNLGIGGNLTVTGTTTFNGGTLTLGDSAADNVVFGADVDSNIIPDDDGAYDLGSSTQEWRDLYLDGTAHIDTLDVDVNATIAGTLGVTGVLTGTSLDISGDIDVDGTTNLDVVDIDGAVDMATTLAVAGNVDFNGDLDVDGTTNLDVVDIDGAVDMATTLAVAGNVDFNGDLDVDGTTNLDVVDIDGAVDMATTLTVGGEITAASLDISGNVDIDGTLETDALSLNGTTVTASAADINLIDGITNGTVIASKAIVTDANIDITGGRNITISGELDAATLDISGNADIDGTLEADAITVNGTALASVIAGTTVNTATVATTVTITDNENTNENNAIVFTAGGDLDGGNLGLESDGDLKYNPSTGTLSATNISVSGTLSTVDSVTMSANNAVVFEGATADAHETTLTVVDATADRTITLPNATGTVSLVTGTETLTNKTLTTPTLTGTTVVASLDISGDIDVDGTTNLDVVDIDGAVDMASTLTIGGVLTANAGSSAFNNDAAGEVVATFNGLHSGSGDVQLAKFQRNGGAVAAAITYADATTDMEFGTTTGHALNLTTNDTRRLNIDSSGNVVINETSVDSDFRVESDGNANMLFVDGGNNRVGIGVVPSHPFHVSAADGTLALFTNASDADLHIKTASAVTLITPSTGTLALGTSDTERFRLDSNGGAIFTSVAGGHVVFNEGGVNADFRVESNALTHGLFLDASTNILHLGGSTQATSTSFLNCGGVTFSNGNAPTGHFFSWDNEGAEAAQQLTAYYYDGAYRDRMSIGGNTGVTSFNNSGVDIDFRIQSADNGNMFFVDAASNEIGIGTSSPDAILHVLKGSAGSVTALSDSTLVLENSTHNYLTFLSPVDKEQAIIFGDASNNNNASVGYNHNTDNLSISSVDDVIFNTSGATRGRFKDAGLDVTGVINATTDITAHSGQFVVKTDGGGSYLGKEDNSTLRIITNNTTRLTIGNSGTVTVAEQLDITDGNLKVANGHGIDFSATGNSSGSMSSELLDDYEEGTFTLTIGVEGQGNATQSNSIANYTKIGNIVHVTFSTGTLSSIPNASTGRAWEYGGLPFTSKNNTGVTPITVRVSSLAADANFGMCGFLYANSNAGRIEARTATATANFSPAMNGANLQVSVTYRTA